MDSVKILELLSKNKIAKGMGLNLENFTQCINAYAEPHRYYHGVSHLFTLFQDIEDNDYPQKDMYEKLQIIALFHDVIYNPRVSDNEKLSADYFKGQVERGAHVSEIYQAIMDTAYSDWSEPSSDLSKEFRELDWDFLYTSSYYDLIMYEKDIMREYQYVEYLTYKAKRVEFLEFVMEKCPDHCKDDAVLDLKVWVDHHRLNIGVYAGSFKPLHIGHLNILEQAERVFDKVIVLSADNPDKPLLENQRWFAELSRALPFHEVVHYAGFTTDYLQRVNEYADVTLVRGLRNGYDLQHEANLRRFMEENGECNVAYFLGGAAYQHISSSDIRGIRHFDEETAKKYLVTKYDYIREGL